MTTFKKKNLKKYKPNVKLDELVDGDGSPIGDTKGSDMNISNDSEIYVPDQQTGDEFVAQALQPNRSYYNTQGTAYSHGEIGFDDDIFDDSIFYNDDESLAEAKMKDMLENILGGKKGDNDIVKQSKSHDVNKDKLPNKDILTNEITNSIDNIIKDINDLNNDEIVASICYLLDSMDLDKISDDYKKLLKKKF